MPTFTSVLTFFSALAIISPAVLAVDPSKTIPNPLIRRARCSQGTYSTNGGNTPCTPCNPGTFSKEQGATRCQDARSGYYVPNGGATTEIPCPAGSYSGSSRSTSCSSCPPGFKCPNSALAQPQQCSPGTYSTGGVTECPRCSAGYFNTIHKATSCCPCAAGWFNANGGNTNCQKCTPQNPYCDPGATSMGSCSSKPGRWAPSASNNMGGDGSCPASQPYVAPSQLARRRVAHAPLCNRAGQKACPIFGFNWRASAHQHQTRNYECVNIDSDLESCGGCVTYSPYGDISPDGGRDCSSIPFVGGVRCEKGQCVIESCSAGFILSANRAHCVPDL